MTREPSLKIIERVADRNDIDPIELQPRLNDAIDPEALDQLFSPLNGGRDRSNGSVSFHYCGYEIAVTSDGVVHVSEPETSPSTDSTASESVREE